MGGNRNSKYIKAFGEHLRKLRLSKKLSQEELAYKCGTTLSQIGRFERGVRSPTLSTILTLSQGLGIEPKKLLDFEF
jgi:transcriptional regulator with XRE-family HTH domain